MPSGPRDRSCVKCGREYRGTALLCSRCRRLAVNPTASVRRTSAESEAAFRARLAELGATLLDSKWLGSHVKYRVRCAAGHDCNPRADHTLTGIGICRVCVGLDPATSEAAFRARLAELGATLLEPKWLGAGSPHHAICANGHGCYPYPNHVKKGGGICRVCAGVDSAAPEAAFRALLIQLGATLLEPEWLGTNTAHRVRCAAGHDCMPQPANVRNGQGICRICTGLDSATAETAFRTRLAELGATLLEPKWLGSRVPHRVRCSAGHESSPWPTAIQQGGGICHYCSGKTWDAFYIVRNASAHRIKFGITTGDPRVRLGRHRSAGYGERIHVLTNLPGELARSIENECKILLRDAGFVPVHGSEYFGADALPVVLAAVDAAGYGLPQSS